MVWAVGDVAYDGVSNPTISFPVAYESVERDPARFDVFIESVATLLLGDMPKSGAKCGNCAYVSAMKDVRG